MGCVQRGELGRGPRSHSGAHRLPREGSAQGVRTKRQESSSNCWFARRIVLEAESLIGRCPIFPIASVWWVRGESRGEADMNTASKEVSRLSAAAVSVAATSHPSGRAIQSTTETSVAVSGQVPTLARAIGSGPHTLRSGPNLVKSRCGTILRRRYRLDAQTVKSALGDHYQAFDLLKRKPCCIKLGRTDAGLAPLAEARLQSEARILARLSHPNIIEACEFNQDESAQSFLVLESVEGSSLYQHLQNKGRLPLSEAMDILRGICFGLSRAHEVGIVHGNLHPGSILLCQKSDASSVDNAVPSVAASVKLTHFELSCELGVCTEEQEAIPPFVLVSTLPYRAPEALVGDMSGLSPRSDIWSVAVMMYQVLSGRLPFAEQDTRKLGEEISFADPMPLSQLVTDLPSYVSDAIMIALSKSRCLRFASAGEFLRAMEGKTPTTDADAQQKGGPTGLFQVTPRLLAECRAQSLMQDAVPTTVSAEHSTRRYPREDYPRDLIKETRPDEENGKTDAPQSSEQRDEELGGGRLLILSVALLTILLGSVFAIGFVIVQRVRHAVMISAQNDCVAVQAEAADSVAVTEADDDAPVAMDATPTASSALASRFSHPVSLSAVSERAPRFDMEGSDRDPAWVPVAPPPVALPAAALPKSSVQKDTPSSPESTPKPMVSPPSSSASVRAQSSERREKKVPQAELDPDLEALPPPADAPPFASEHREAYESAPDSQKKDSSAAFAG